jgi:hypothetical protein
MHAYRGKTERALEWSGGHVDELHASVRHDREAGKEQTALHEQIVRSLGVPPRANPPARDPLGNHSETEYDSRAEHRAPRGGPQSEQHRHDHGERDDDDCDLYAPQREQLAATAGATPVDPPSPRALRGAVSRG